MCVSSSVSPTAPCPWATCCPATTAASRKKRSTTSTKQRVKSATCSKQAADDSTSRVVIGPTATAKTNRSHGDAYASPPKISGSKASSPRTNAPCCNAKPTKPSPDHNPPMATDSKHKTSTRLARADPVISVVVNKPQRQPLLLRQPRAPKTERPSPSARSESPPADAHQNHRSPRRAERAEARATSRPVVETDDPADRRAVDSKAAVVVVAVAAAEAAVNAPSPKQRPA